MNALRAAACAALFCCAAAAQANCKLQTMELPVHIEGWRAIATMGINGTPVPMMVASGMFYSVLTRESAEQLGLPLQRLPAGYKLEGPAGKMVGLRKTLVKSVQLQNAQIEDIEFLVGGNASELGAMGIIGRNILGAFDVEYDLAHGMIRLIKPDGCDNANMAYWADALPVSQVPLLPDQWRVRPAVRANVMLNGHEVIAAFDTGTGTHVSLKAAHKAGLQDADLRGSSVAYGPYGDGHLRWWTGNFDRVSLGGETVIHNRLGVSDFDSGDYDMLIGIDFFLSHRIYVSKDRALMFFTYNGGPVFARNVEPQADPASAPASQAADTLSADALFRRGMASLARKDVAGALADLDRACAMAPDDAGYHYGRAEARARANDKAKALADLDTALTLDPKLDDARLMRARWSLGGDPARALQDLAILDETLPSRSNMRASVATAYQDWARFPLAIRQWTLWIDNHRDDVRLPGARSGRAWARVEANVELDQAMDDCDEAIDRQPDTAGFRSIRGWLQLRLNQPAKARADFDGALKLEPTEPFALYGRALIHTKRGNTAAAQADLAAARQAEPKIDEWVKNDGLEVAP
jgi:tetratricopeptide (TPR) repeat protein